MDLRKAQANVLALAHELIIDTADGPRRLGPLLNPFQREFFEAVSPALERLCGRPVEPSYQRFWEERSRGHSKSGDLALVILWLLIFSRRKVTGIGAAADRDQARLLRDSCEALVRLNPVLAEIIDVQAYRVVNRHTGSTFEIIASDAASSFGVTPDLIVCDEVCHWSGTDLWNSLLSSAAKKANCVMVCITNAGHKQSEWWPIREAIRVDAAWRFSSLPGAVASWIKPEHLAEQRRLLPAAVYGRLWDNQWLDGGASDALTSGDIESALTMTGPPVEPETGWRYLAALDIGLRRDASCLLVLGRHVGSHQRVVTPPRPLPSVFRSMADAGLYDAPAPRVEYRTDPPTGRLKLAAVRIWNPQNGERVELDQIEQEVLALHQRFNLASLSFDPWQAEHLAQRVAKAGIYCDRVNFTSANLQAMAANLLEAFREKQLALWPHADLVADLRRLQVEQKSYGYRLVSPRTTAGNGTAHGDTATALAMALNAAKAIRSESALCTNRQLVYN